MEPQQEAQVYQKHLLEASTMEFNTNTTNAQTATGSVLVQVSVLEAPLGLDVVQDLLQLLVFEATFQTEHTC